MVIDFTVLMLALAVAVPLYWAIPKTLPGVRLLVPIALSALVLTLLSPLVLISVLFYAVILAVFVGLKRRGTATVKRLKQASWVAFLPLTLVPFVPAALWAGPLLGPEALKLPTVYAFAYLGISYTAIRVFILVREHIDSQPLTFTQTVCALVFFGSFSAGPIVGGGPYRAIRDKTSLEDLTQGLARIGWGTALFVVVKPLVEGLDLTMVAGETGRALVWATMFRDFLALYIDFTGYCDIAIGTALLFGIRLPENFRWPLVATSIQEFWQRWHLSLGAFIGTYLFKPIVRQTGRPALGIFLAFVFVGLWHTFSLPYLIWGIGHGAALALTMTLRKAGAFSTKSVTVGRLMRLGGWALTLSFVAFMSSFANQPSLEDALGFAQSLIFK